MPPKPAFHRHAHAGTRIAYIQYDQVVWLGSRANIPKKDKAQPNPHPIPGTNQKADNLVKINATKTRRLSLRENAKRAELKEENKKNKWPQKRHCIAYMGRKPAAESSGQVQIRNLVVEHVWFVSSSVMIGIGAQRVRKGNHLE